MDKSLFDKLKMQFLSLDPVSFAEAYLMLDNKPFRLTGNGFKPFADIYRYIGLKAIEPTGKPVILVKGRQVGGTTMASVLEMYFMGSGLFGVGNNPPIRIMHTFPLGELAAAYSKTKLSSMINSSVMTGESKPGLKQKSYMQSLLDTSTPTNDSLSFKQFVGGNHLWIESIGLDGDRVMGRTCDIMFYDEVQRTTDHAIGNSSKILTTAKYGRPGKGAQIFFGTPRRKGTGFHKMWQSSSQQYFNLGCEKCKDFFPLYTPESDEWEKIWIHGFIVRCTHCGHEQDKRDAAERGKWIALKNVDDDDCKMVGFHINQLYMPNFTKESLMDEKPGVSLINTERTYQNEVLGEFYQGDTSPITQEEIRELCGDVGRKFKQRINSGEEQLVVLGIDYGAKADMEQMANPEKSKGGQSYSTAVILTAKGPQLLNIDFCMKFKRNDPESKKGIIDELIRKFSVNLVVGDIGFSNDFSVTLHNIYGDKYLVSRAHSKVNGHVKYNTDTFPKEITFERDFYIGELYEQMKKGQIRFPFGDYEKIGWLIEHCASMEIKPSISRTGDPSIHYIKGSTPNDGFMALLNAYIAYKFIVTKSFSTQNPLLFADAAGKSNKPLAITGVIKRRL